MSIQYKGNQLLFDKIFQIFKSKMSQSINQDMSLFIPHVFENICKDQIIQVIEKKYMLGKVKTVDTVLKADKDHNYQYVYVHFDYWNDNGLSRRLQSDIMDPNKEARIYYMFGSSNINNDKYYWVVLENKAKRQISGARKPRIIIEESLTEKKELHEFSTPEKPMHNKDFSKLMNAPIKKCDEKTETLEGKINKYIDECAKKIDFDEIDDNYIEEEDCMDMDEIDIEFERQNMELISSDYASYLENKVQDLMYIIDRLNFDKINLLTQNEMLKLDVKNQEYMMSIAENREPFYRPYWL